MFPAYLELRSISHSKAHYTHVAISRAITPEHMSHILNCVQILGGSSACRPYTSFDCIQNTWRFCFIWIYTHIQAIPTGMMPYVIPGSYDDCLELIHDFRKLPCAALEIARYSVHMAPRPLSKGQAPICILTETNTQNDKLLYFNKFGLFIAGISLRSTCLACVADTPSPESPCSLSPSSCAHT